MTPLSWSLFALTVVLDVFGQTTFKLGLGKIEGALGLAFWRGVATSPWVIAGFAGYSIEAMCWMYVLGHGPMSVVGPMAALSYVGAVLSGQFFLGERAGPRRWIGAGLVTLGAGMVGASL